ncbi:MAG TPA: glutamine-hydrolyzing GMP synthase [Anaerolineae bacterium]|nr:glutamine-hydrolyzing GMP synthase [Anaerolineae bacterium]
MDSLSVGLGESIAIIDFGSQYSQLIARRVRECDVYCQLVPHTADLSAVEALAPMGFILSGGPASVYGQDAPRLPAYVLEQGRPVLGICYGMQLVIQALGGRVAAATECEYGPAKLTVSTPHSSLFYGLPSDLGVWMSHGDKVQSLPPGFRVLASSRSTRIAACGDVERRIYGLQFHPEVTHTPQGPQILRNFLYKICGCHGTWKATSFISDAVASIQRQVGCGRAICGLSGGIDSTVAAALVQKAIGDRLTCIFVNHGLLRLDEAEQNLELFDRHRGLRVTYVDAADRFLRALAGISDPEEKRRIIGHEFIRVFETEARKLGGVDFLVQGTLYPDVIESSGTDTRTVARIKTHHNVGGLPEDMELDLVEPLRFLFKDEVRRVGRALGLPDEIVHRQPFPGPGLAIRVIGPVTWERLELLRAADAIVRAEIASAGLANDVWQFFAVLTPVRTVGVMGDGRTYDNVVAVRAVTSEDGMTADWARLPPDVLALMSSRITNEVGGVNRVVYDISSKPPATIEWE